MANQVLASFMIQVKAVRLHSTREGLVNMSVQFMRDPTNTHDRYCVEVFLCGGRKLGHVARISSMEISYLLPRSFDTKGEAEQTRMCACTIRV